MASRRPLVRCFLHLLVVVISGFASSARAQQIAVDAFLPAPDQTGFMGFASTRTPGPWGVDSTLWLDYGWHTLEESSYGPGNAVPIKHRLDGTLIVQLGVATRGALALRLPFVLVQRGDDVPELPHLSPTAVGNPAIDGRVRLIGAPARPDGTVSDGGALALRGVVQTPAGTTDSFFADDAWRTDLSLIGDVEMFGIGAGAAFGWRHRFDDDRFAGRSFQDELRLAFGARLPLPMIARAFPGKLQESVLLEFDMGTTAKNFFAKATTPVEIRFAYRAIVRDFYMTLGLGAGLTSAIGSPDLRTFFTFGWSPRTHDQDADGVPDDEDQCEHLPEDRDGFQDEDGCADDDNDGDLIVDEDDRCPMQAAEMGRDEDEDGCTDP